MLTQLPSEDNLDANEGNKRLTFNLRKDITERGIKKVLLYLFIRKPLNPDPTHPDPWLLVYHNSILIGRRRLEIIEPDVVYKLLKIDLTQNVQDFVREREQILKNHSSNSSPLSLDPRLDKYQLDVICLDREGNSMVVKTAHNREELLHMPILEIHIKDALLSRIKRGNRDDTCHSSSTDADCCRYNLVIDFDKLGWEWVLRPRRIRINYCSGDCQFVQRPYYRLTEPYLGSPEAPGMKRCCSAKSFSPVPILYKADDNQTLLTTLNNLVVDRCGCI